MKLYQVIFILCLVSPVGAVDVPDWNQPALTSQEKNLPNTWFNNMIDDKEEREWETQQQYNIDSIENRLDRLEDQKDGE